jgi:hypothetical protein
MSKIMPPSSYSPEAEAALYGELKNLAELHVERSGGELSILPHNIKKYPAQALGVFVVPGEIAEPDGIDFIGSRKMPRFAELSTDIMETEQATGQTLRQKTEDLLLNKQSIVVHTDHDDVTSPGYGLGGVANPLRKANNERAEEDRIDFETGIIVGKMLSVLAYKVGDQWVPCMQVLQWMCDRVYLTYPRSKTFLNSGAAKVLPPGHLEKQNGGAKTDIEKWMGHGGVILGASLLGSTHERRKDGKVQRLPRVTKGSGEMATHDRVHVLAMIVGLLEKDPYMQAVGSFQQFATWEDAHPLSERMAAARTARSNAEGSNITYEYETAEQAKAARLAKAKAQAR